MFEFLVRKNKPKMEELLQPVSNYTVPTRIVVQENEYRPCYVRGSKALFHRWANTARPVPPRGADQDENTRYFQYRATLGIVEFEDGTVERVWPQDIQFADGGRFKEYAWGEEQEDAHGDY
jgi:hypothetical protein